MKQLVLLLTGAAFLFMGCAKDQNEDATPEKGKHVVKLSAYVDNTDTRVSITETGETASFSWQLGDWIGVFTDYRGDFNEVKWLEIYNSGEIAEFEIILDNEETLGQYAVYPVEEGCGFDPDMEVPVLGLSDYYEYTYYNRTLAPMPMLGTISSHNVISNTEDDYEVSFKASFKAVGGLLKVEIDNIPEDAEWLEFSVSDKRITGGFPVIERPDGSKIINVEPYDEATYDGHNYIRFRINDDYVSDRVFYIPLPCGTYNNLKFSFYDEMSDDPIVSKTAKIKDGLVVKRNDIIVAPPLEL